MKLAEIPTFAELREIFLTNERALSMLYMLLDAKPCVRIMATDEELKNIEKFCAKHQIWCDTSDFRICVIKDSSKGGYSNKGIASGAGERAVYISKNEMIVRHAKQHEKQRDSCNLGLDLGYPDCCCQSFSQNEAKNSQKGNDFVLSALQNSTLDIFPFQLNNTLRYFDKSIIPHFPCSYECEKSVVQAQEFMKIIETFTPLKKEIMETLKSPVIYTESNGVFRLKNAAIEKFEIKYEGVEGTTGSSLYGALCEGNRIEIKRRDFLRIHKGGRLLHELNSPDCAILLFE